VRIGLISDIHGNLPALEAVLAELDRERPDTVVCLGDVALGPQPRETLARISERGYPVVMGNWDAYLLGEATPSDDEGGRAFAEVGSWVARLLSPEDRELVRGFRDAVEVSLGPDAALLCYHGSPRSFDEWILASTPDGELDAMLADAQASVFAGGHTHLQMLRRRGDSLVVNPGSVGMPFRRWWPDDVRVGPWAEYGILSADDGRLSIDLRRTPVGVDEYLRAVRDSGMPLADWWMESWTRD
jgi:predicted phosphodiesterase